MPPAVGVTQLAPRSGPLDITSQQICPAAQQALPQQSAAPQLAPALHGACAHTPPEQNGAGPGQTTPQPPQLKMSLRGFTQPDAQQASGAPQPGSQAKPPSGFPVEEGPESQPASANEQASANANASAKLRATAKIALYQNDPAAVGRPLTRRSYGHPPRRRNGGMRLANLAGMARWRRRLFAAAGALALVGYRLRARRPVDLTGQVALVTGGSRGLGLLLAREFFRAGCKIVICARDPGELQAAREDLELRGADVLAARCDVTDRADCESLVERTLERFGRVDLLVNNAGIIQVGPVESMTIADFERAMQVNFWGVVHMTLAVLPEMRRRRAGRIVNITSIGGKVAVPHLLPYDCAKFAAMGFSEGLHAELEKDGITVTTVVPGLMRTGSPPFALFKGQREREYRWFATSDRLPITSMSAIRAAREIVLAVRRGETEVTLSWPARVLRLVHALWPAATTDLLAQVNHWLLPSSVGGSRFAAPGLALSTAPRT